MKVERIDVLNFYVKDLERAVAFFSELMGTEFVGPIEKEAHEPEELVDKAKVTERHARIAISKPIGGVGVLLTQPTKPDDSIARWIDEHGEGLASIGLKVTDRDEAISELEAKGFTLKLRTMGVAVTSIGGKTLPGKSGVKAATLTAPDNAYGGLQFYLLEYKDVHGLAMGHAHRLEDLPWM